MRVIEARDGFIKLEANDSVNLSSFVKINGEEKNYVAQIVQIKKSDNIAFAKILFLFSDKLEDYDKTLPPKDSEAIDFTDYMLKILSDCSQPVIAGKTINNVKNIVIDASCFNKQMLISVDDNLSINILFKNLSRQLENHGKNVIIIDTLGTLEANKYTAGKDFKLPLDTTSLEFLYKECLNDATSDSKSMIIELFKELSEYSKTVSFLPFKALKTIVDDMVDKSHVFKLLVLKNKLAKLEKLGYFATENKETEKINKIISAKCAVIDLSKLDTAFQNRYLNYIYSKLENKNAVLLTLSNTVSKKSLKAVFESSIMTTFATHSNFKYLSDIRNFFDNCIVFPSVTNSRVFREYSTFLNVMDKQSYIIVGKGTNYVPIISQLGIIEETIAGNNEEILKELEQIPYTENIETDSENSNSEEYKTEIAVNQEIEDDTIIASINEKSQNVISDIAENLEEPQKINVFAEDESEESDQEPILEETLSENNDSEIDNINNDKEEQQNVDVEVIEPEIVTSDDLYSETASEEAESIETIDLTETDNSDLISEENSEEQTYSLESEEVFSNSNEDALLELSLENSNEEQIVQPEELSENQTVEDAEETEIMLDDDIDLDLEPMEETEESADIIEEPAETIQEEIPEPEVLKLNEDDYGTDDIVELPVDEVSEDDIIIDMTDDSDIIDENIEEQIKQDVDKVYTTRKDDDFSESDLDLIDEINNEEEIVLPESDEDDSILEEVSDSEIIEEYHSPEEPLEQTSEEPEILEKRDSSTPIVPVYDAEIPQEDIVMSDPIEQGDSVTHLKYGNGVVEKLVKYGQKTLYMINFDMAGRKLLDPLLTEIKKA